MCSLVFSHSVSAELAKFRQGLLRIRFATACVLRLLQAILQGRGWMRCLLFSIMFLVMVMLFASLFDICLVYVQLLCRISHMNKA